MPEQKNDLKNWCKIFKLDARDILVQKIYDPEKDKDVVIISTPSLCAFINVTMGFDTPEKADKAFDDINNETIDAYADKCFGAFIRSEQETMIEEE